MGIPRRAFAYRLDADALHQRLYKPPPNFPGEGLIQPPIEGSEQIPNVSDLSLRLACPSAGVLEAPNLLNEPGALALDLIELAVEHARVDPAAAVERNHALPLPVLPG